MMTASPLISFPFLFLFLYSRLQNKAGRRQNFQVPLKTAKMTIENIETIVATAEENYISRPEHSFAVAAGRKF